MEEVHSGRAVVRGDEAHHLTRVLRVEAGQKYEISDNRDVYLAEVETARKDTVSFVIVEKLAASAAAVRPVVLAALIKFDRFEWLVEKATELGAEAIVPFVAERSEKGLDRAAANRVVRWRKIAREASEQSRRDRLPEVGDVVGFEEALRYSAAFRFVLEEAGGATPMLAAMPAERRARETVAMMVGPEGGWTEREREAMREAGWTAVSLGLNILRAETAAAAALAIVNAAWALT